MKHQRSARKRRGLGALALLLTAGGLLAGCGEAQEQPPSNDFVFTTSIEAGHQHTVTLSRSTLDNPPPTDLEFRTSTDSGHDHGVRLTPAEVQTLREGRALTKTTTVNDGHSHTVPMQRP